MFDVALPEFLLVAVVALVVIGPKDLPKAMRVAGYWVGRMRGVARQFRTGFDNMVREAELEEMEKRWAAENERIMREHGAGAQTGSAQADPVLDAATVDGAASAIPSDDVGSSDAPESPPPPSPAPLPDDASEPVYVEKPEIRPAPTGTPAPRGDGVTS